MWITTAIRTNAADCFGKGDGRITGVRRTGADVTDVFRFDGLVSEYAEQGSATGRVTRPWGRPERNAARAPSRR